MQEKTCCVRGQSKIPADKLDSVRRELEREIGAALEDGYRTFLTVFAEGADALYLECVIAHRENYPDIFLEAIIPTPAHAEKYNYSGWELLAKCTDSRFCAKSAGWTMR